MVLFLVLMGCPSAPHTMNEGWVYTLEDEDLDSEGLTETDDEETEEDTVVEDESVPDGLVVGEDELEEPEEFAPEYTEGCSVAEYNGHSYGFCDFSLTRIEAQEECIDMGLLLVEIGDAAENEWVVEQSLERVAGNIWLGLKMDDSDYWFWPSGDLQIYRHWHPGEPNNSGGREGCTEMYLGGIEDWQLGKWNDTSCGLSRRFVCEQVDLD